MSPVLEYVVNSLGWSLAGFAAGWAVASLRRDLTTIKEAVVDDTPDGDQLPAHTSRVSTDTATRWLGIVVALLAIVTVTQGVIAQRRIGEVTSCQARFNSEFAQATSVRAQLANEDRLALQNMLLALYRQRGADEARRLETFQEWVRTVEQSERERAEHPLPELPKGDCR